MINSSKKVYQKYRMLTGRHTTIWNVSYYYPTTLQSGCNESNTHPPIFSAIGMSWNYNCKNPRIKIAQDILDSMLRREKGLIDSPVVLTSVFTDPRFRILLNDEDNIKSLKHLDMLRRRMNISRASEMVSLHNTHNFFELSLLIEVKRIKQHMDLCNIEFFQIISNAPHL